MSSVSCDAKKVDSAKEHSPWPECFISGVVREDDTRESMCLAGLVAWGNLTLGMTPTKAFYEVMGILAKRLGIEGSAQSFMDESDRLQAGEPSNIGG